jgi:hypothetical protein
LGLYLEDIWAIYLFRKPTMITLVKGAFVGLICGAVILGAVTAIFHFPDFFDRRYLAVFQPEYRILGITWKVTTIRGDALSNTLIASCLGAIVGTVVGVIWASICLIRSRI